MSSRLSGDVRLPSWLLGVLTVGFTIALTFASIELPHWLAGLADRWIDIPDYNPFIEPAAVEAFLRRPGPSATHALR